MTKMQQGQIHRTLLLLLIKNVYPQSYKFTTSTTKASHKPVCDCMSSMH